MKKLTLVFCPTIFLGVTTYNVFALVISVLQWKIGSGGTLVGQICGEHARGKRPLPVGGWVGGPNVGHFQMPAAPIFTYFLLPCPSSSF